MNKHIYLTTAIAYANAKPHLGHALEFILGDAYLRFYKSHNYNVLGQTGTDEYGQKLERKAKELGQNPQDYCDKISIHFRELQKTFNLSYDQFIRTTDEEHTKSVQKIWSKAFKSGDIYKKKYEGLYCTGCESFKTETDLIDKKCPNHNIEPEKIEEENYFFRLSKYSNKIEKWLLDNPKIVFPESRYKEILNIVKSGLEDISISRPKTSLKWGIEVPNDSSHVMYVWFDALTNYITGVGYENNQNKFNKWWNNDAFTIHIIGKDIIRQHIAIWPGMLLSAGIDLPKQYMVHGFLQSEGKKMSKSLGNIVDPVEVANKYGTDSLRWYLLKEIPNGQDGDFSVNRFQEIYNSDLANNMGNLLNRVTTLLIKYDIKIPNSLPEISFLQQSEEEYDKSFKSFRIEQAANQIINICNKANLLIETKKPWVLAKSNTEELNTVMIELFTYLISIHKSIQPFMPETANKIGESLGVDDNYNVKKIDVLFPRLEN